MWAKISPIGARIALCSAIGGALGWLIGTLYPSLNQPLGRLTLLSGVIGSVIGAATSRRGPPIQ
jgi:uncharacterized membrane protein YfcA